MINDEKCPFCGAEAKRHQSAHELVGCTNGNKCAIGGYMFSETQWNKRAPKRESSKRSKENAKSYLSEANRLAVRVAALSGALREAISAMKREDFGTVMLVPKLEAALLPTNEIEDGDSK